MKRTLFTLLVVTICAPLVFASYPDEYPIYLRFFGFSKSEIRDLQDGGFITHMIRNRMPGEYGTIAAQVHGVPVYYFRDYYSYIENYKSLLNFQQVGKFKERAGLQDLRGLQFDDSDLHDFLACRQKNCGLKLSSREMSRIPQDVDITNDSGKERVSNVYRQILLDRLMAYQKEGMEGLADYEDDAVPYRPSELLKSHLLKFEHIGAYFPIVERYLKDYPRYKNKRIDEFFYWSKEYLGNKPVIAIRHVFSQKVGEDYIIVNKLVYSNHYFLSSIALIHLINYADREVPRTLLVFEQRTLTDLKGDPFDAIGRNILRNNLEKRVALGFKMVGKTMEERYFHRSYAGFPYGLLPRDQR